MEIRYTSHFIQYFLYCIPVIHYVISVIILILYYFYICNFTGSDSRLPIHPFLHNKRTYKIYFRVILSPHLPRLERYTQAGPDPLPIPPDPATHGARNGTWALTDASQTSLDGLVIIGGL